MTIEIITEWFSELQNTICRNLEKLDGKGIFREDHWQRQGGGGGRTRILEAGNIIEKGGVNFSAVHGKMPDRLARSQNLPDSDFYATGISIVLHPVSPMIPIIHMNTRYFEMKSGEQWFGGGIDLTPHYIGDKDAVFFHRQLKSICDRFDKKYYDRFKKWADDYFYIKHRNETRGIGGIFFDHLFSEDPHQMKKIFEFTRDVGESFFPIYDHLVKNNLEVKYGESELKWQKIRRGRYVEFNLVYDRGTRFGLETSGRTESILMSLPQEAAWIYNHEPEKGSDEYETLKKLKKGIDWIHYKED